MLCVYCGRWLRFGGYTHFSQRLMRVHINQRQLSLFFIFTKYMFIIIMAYVKRSGGCAIECKLKVQVNRYNIFNSIVRYRLLRCTRYNNCCWPVAGYLDSAQEVLLILVAQFCFTLWSEKSEESNEYRNKVCMK